MPIFFLRDLNLDNEINLEVTLGFEDSQELFSYYETNEISDFETLNFRKTYNIKPEITYNFSKFVDANLWYDYIFINDSNTGKETKHKVGFNIRIYFESF